MLRTLIHHWRIHLAVMIGAAVACAVLAGALLVGDSVRGSLRALTLDRLGSIDHLLVSSRFMRQTLAAELAADPEFSDRHDALAPLVVLRGSAVHADSQTRAAGVGIYGVDATFGAMYDTLLDFERRDGQVFPSVIINQTLATELAAEEGEAILLHFGRFSEIPRETLMGDKDPDQVLGSVRLTVSAILPDRGLGRFSVSPTQSTAPAAFLSLKQIQRSLSLGPEINAIAVSGDAQGEGPQALFSERLRLGDLGLDVELFDEHLSLTSSQFVIPPALDEALSESAAELHATDFRIQSYLANEIRIGSRSVPYSMVAAVDPHQGLSWAELISDQGLELQRPGDDAILLNRWAADALHAAVGDIVEVTYFEVAADESLVERSTSFHLEGVAAMSGLGADKKLTPEYPGIQDSDDISDWDPPFPVELDRIGDADEEYWDDYGAAPKAFVNGDTGRRLWATRFGSTTALRIGTPAGITTEEFQESLRQTLLRSMPAEAHGLAFRAAKSDGLRAAEGATDFSMLFISFSFFLILSAALLIGLLFRLSVEQRASEIGLLLAVGYRVRRVLLRLLGEGMLLAAVGALGGLAGAIAFAWGMMAGLRTIWRPAVGSSELYLFITPTSLIVGWVATMFVVAITIFLAVRKLVRMPPPRLLLGVVELPTARRAALPSLFVAWGGLLAGLAMVAASFRLEGVSPGLAFGAGSALLIGGLSFFSRWCRGSGGRGGVGGLVGMAARNSAWNPGRSMLSVALVASACFMVVVVEVFRIDPDAGQATLTGGAGGYTLVARSDVPLHQDLNRREDLQTLGFSDEQLSALDGVEVTAARMSRGDDASCLNLYRPERPTLVGVPPAFVERGGFSFAQLDGDATTSANPWELLEQQEEPGLVPFVTDLNSAMWILHLKLGDELVIDDELGMPMRLKLVGMLDRSLFRSELLISEQQFKTHFPSAGGDSYFLVQVPPGQGAEVSQLLEKELGSFGFDATDTAQALAGYDAVQNTYLSTFQVLGGLGLLLGTIGLGVVLVRNVIERRGELATLRAFGFRRRRLALVVLAENAFLLAVGIGVGVMAALLAVLPSLIGKALPWSSLVLAVALVVTIGMLSSIAAVSSALRVPLLPLLKSEG